MNANQIEKKPFKKEINRLAKAITIYEVIMILVTLGYIMVQAIMILFSDAGAAEEDILNSMLTSGMSSILGVVVGLLLINRYRKKTLSTDIILAQNNTMTTKKFLSILVVFMSVQAVFQFVSWGGESALNFFGYTMQAEIESATAVSSTVSMVLYASLIGPVAEELVFRGIALRALEKYGKVFAIVVSAVMFGCFHSNLIQGLFATMVGIVLAYLTLEYSIKWAILLHVINNFVFSYLLGIATSGLTPNMQSLIINGIVLLFFIGGIIILWRKRVAVKQYLAGSRAAGKSYLYTLTSRWVLVFIIFNLLMGIGGITPL